VASLPWFGSDNESCPFNVYHHQCFLRVSPDFHLFHLHTRLDMWSPYHLAVVLHHLDLGPMPEPGAKECKESKAPTESGLCKWLGRDFPLIYKPVATVSSGGVFLEPLSSHHKGTGEVVALFPICPTEPGSTLADRRLFYQFLRKLSATGITMRPGPLRVAPLPERSPTSDGATSAAWFLLQWKPLLEVPVNKSSVVSLHEWITGDLSGKPVSHTDPELTHLIGCAWEFIELLNRERLAQQIDLDDPQTIALSLDAVGRVQRMFLMHPFVSSKSTTRDPERPARSFRSTLITWLRPSLSQTACQATTSRGLRYYHMTSDLWAALTPPPLGSSSFSLIASSSRSSSMSNRLGSVRKLLALFHETMVLRGYKDVPVEKS
jgi:hypothetical protein